MLSNATFSHSRNRGNLSKVDDLTTGGWSMAKQRAWVSIAPWATALRHVILLLNF
jgi:hypothetical protein